MYRLHRNKTINGHFSIKYIHFCLDTTWLFSSQELDVWSEMHVKMAHIDNPIRQAEGIQLA